MIEPKRLTFKDCIAELGDICMLCGRPDEEDFDNGNDKCQYDEKKKSNSECEGFICGEQCRFCNPLCEEVSKR